MNEHEQEPGHYALLHANGMKFADVLAVHKEHVLLDRYERGLIEEDGRDIPEVVMITLAEEDGE